MRLQGAQLSLVPVVEVGLFAGPNFFAFMLRTTSSMWDVAKCEYRSVILVVLWPNTLLIARRLAPFMAR